MLERGRGIKKERRRKVEKRKRRWGNRTSKAIDGLKKMRFLVTPFFNANSLMLKREGRMECYLVGVGV
jgi:hypothetical protein